MLNTVHCCNFFAKLVNFQFTKINIFDHLGGKTYDVGDSQTKGHAYMNLFIYYIFLLVGSKNP